MRRGGLEFPGAPRRVIAMLQSHAYFGYSCESQIQRHFLNSETTVNKPPFNITVNNHEVPWPAADHTATGAEIKAAAIAAGVKIDPDFLLSMETRKGTFTLIDDDETVKVKHTSLFVAVEPDFNIIVNKQKVAWPKQDRKATGAEIKAAAIAAGVDIKPDFLLSAKNHKGVFKRVNDDEIVKLEDCKEFRAVGADDNS